MHKSINLAKFLRGCVGAGGEERSAECKAGVLGWCDANPRRRDSVFILQNAKHDVLFLCHCERSNDTDLTPITRSAHINRIQKRNELLHSFGAVADAVFLFHAHFGKGYVIALGFKNRIVPKTFAPA